MRYPPAHLTDTARTLALDHEAADWAGLRVAVAGLGVSGFAAADVLLQRGARVVAVDERSTEHATVARDAELVDVLGGRTVLGPGATAALPQIDGQLPDLVVTSPGWRPDAPMLLAATAAGVPIWGEVELAWRLRRREGAAPWLTLTGTNGKTTTVKMLEAMLVADGRRAIAVGNVGTPLLTAIVDPIGYDVLAVELSSFQLHWSHSLRPQASLCLNIAPDHVDWHGSLDEYARAKGRVYSNTEIACVYNVADPATEQLVRDADVVEGARAIGFTAGIPDVSMLGVVDDVLADRAFLADRRTTAIELAAIQDLREAGGGVVAPHTITNALAAAALARAHGVAPASVRDGLRSMRPEPHRIATVAEIDRVRWVDDSKATNPHAAAASLAAFDSIVWVAGGLLKGADITDLVRRVAPRLRGVVLIGVDREPFVSALARHAPDIPVLEVGSGETGRMHPASQLSHDPSAVVMAEAVRAAGGLARPGDTVLLAPAAASMDQFTNYVHRGDAFAAAVREHAGRAKGEG
ncbi:MAG: UDP-N-acetylmuramoyl-L-alanine--D-glutamate ligase [Actinomycetales bacterium]